MKAVTTALLAGVLWVTAAAGPVGAQVQEEPSAEPLEARITEAQRDELLELIDAADSEVIPVDQATWDLHFLKAADGLGYVPFTVRLDEDALPGDAATVYVRVASVGADEERAEHSVLQRWLQQARVQAAPSSERLGSLVGAGFEGMPVGGPVMSLGPGAEADRLKAAQAASMSLRMLEQELSATKPPPDPGETAGPQDDGFVYPFEDFGFIDLANRREAGALSLTRAVAVPPGEYELTVALTEPGARAPDAARATVLLRRTLVVPDFWTGDLELSSVILAERLETLPRPYESEEQSAHPYAFGWAEVVPAADRTFWSDERLEIVFQVNNPVADATGKPDVMVEYRVQPLDEEVAEAAPIEPQHYNSGTLPLDFDLTQGHQLFAVQSLTLSDLLSGEYEVVISATDRRTGSRVEHVEPFAVRATEETLRRAAPAVVEPFDLDAALSPEMTTAVLSWAGGIDPVPPGLVEALDHVRTGRFAAVLGSLPQGDRSDPLVSLATGIALLGISDAPDAATAHFRSALRGRPDLLSAIVYLGVSYAARGQDREAVGAWQLGLLQELDGPALHALIAGAYLRLEEPDAALAILDEAAGQWPASREVALGLARVHLTSLAPERALAALEPFLASHPSDAEGLFLALRALFDTIGAESEPPPVALDRFESYAAAYERASGAHARLVAQWQDWVNAPKPPRGS